MVVDVIVVGAGPAGAIAATLLARAGARVRLYDRARFPRAKLCGDTLNPGAMHLLARHVTTHAIAARALPLEGMLLTGPGGAAVQGRYPRGLLGRALSRRELDAHLVEEAVRAGADFVDGVAVLDALTDGARVIGVRTRGAAGRCGEQRAALVVAADGRGSRLARRFQLARHPAAPRRWAAGAYFEGVRDLQALGEMHVRRGHYIGVAPMPGGVANACVVGSRGTGGEWRDPAALLVRALRADPQLAPRFARARLVQRVQTLGPMAVDAASPGVPGMLVAGDAGGFVDPMTGDGLRFAIAGAVLAAAIGAEVLSGRLDPRTAISRLAARRRRMFAWKWRFNRALRALVSSGASVEASAMAARIAPAAFEAIIRYAGDCALSDA